MISASAKEQWKIECRASRLHHLRAHLVVERHDICHSLSKCSVDYGTRIGSCNPHDSNSDITRRIAPVQQRMDRHEVCCNNTSRRACAGGKMVHASPVVLVMRSMLWHSNSWIPMDLMHLK